MSSKLHYFTEVIRGKRRGVAPTLLRWGLHLVSGPYSLATRMRNFAFDRGWKESIHVDVPVVSIGNLTVGGTGKTPCVEHVARFYREQDLRVAILSRGYGTEHGPNDEALVLEESLPDVPHLQGADRAALAQVAIEELESEILILDDGFQHRRLARDLDIVLIDCTDPWGQGYVLPRGLLRESPKGLKRASAVLLTRCDQVEETQRQGIREQIQRIVPEILISETCHRPLDLVTSEGQSTSLDVLQSHPIIAFCGIGNPESFRQSLLKLGANLLDFRIFDDHHAYTHEDVTELKKWAKSHPSDTLVLTTQKDLVKLRVIELSTKPLHALRISLQGIEPESLNNFHERLRTVIP